MLHFHYRPLKETLFGYHLIPRNKLNKAFKSLQLIIQYSTRHSNIGYPLFLVGNKLPLCFKLVIPLISNQIYESIYYEQIRFSLNCS